MITIDDNIFTAYQSNYDSYHSSLEQDALENKII